MSTYEDIRIFVNGVELPAPSTMDLEYEDLDADSMRDINSGTLHRNRIRSNVMKIKVSYLVADLGAIAKVYTMLKPTSFKVSVYDDASGKRVNKQMYCSKKSHSYIRTQNGIRGKGVSFSIIEV